MERRAGSGVAAQRSLSQQAKSILVRATELDGQGDTAQALQLYQQGRDVLETALSLSFAPGERQVAEAEEGRLRSHLALVDERMTALLSQQQPQAQQPATPRGWMQSLFGTRKPSSPTPQPQPQPQPQPHQPHQPRPAQPSNARVGGGQGRQTNLPAQRQDNNARAAGSGSSGIKGVSTEMQHRILDEVVDNSPGVSWDDIAGLEQAKQAIQEIIILPSLRPDLFTGLRSPPKGVLLYGPPGTGKTMLAKAIATESKMVFFSISASSLMSKWVGDGEKMVRALFAVARHLQPSVIFIDEIDSMLGQRSDNENDAARRVKTEFLVQFDGAATAPNDRILVLGATNTPWTLDEAARRRLAKRIYIPLPDGKARKAMLRHLLRDQRVGLTGRQWTTLVNNTEGYSGSDLRALCSEAVMGPVREMGRQLVGVDADQLRATSAADFKQAMGVIRPSVAQHTLARYEEWSDQFGTRGA